MHINFNKYIKRFDTEAEFLAFKSSSDYMEPNISFVNESDGIHFGEPAGIVDPYLSMPLTFEILKNGIITVNAVNNNNLAYRILNDENQDSEWQEYNGQIEVYAGDKVEFVGDNIIFSEPSYYPTNFNITTECNIYGNIMSLLDSENYATKTSFNVLDDYGCFRSLFSSSTGIISAEHLKLPVTILATGCYRYMFQACTSLTTAPELPATTLAESCYYSMFSGCTSLTTAPELPATTLADYCYEFMFIGCTSLDTVKAWFTNADAVYCLDNWMNTAGSNNNYNDIGLYIKHSTYTTYGRGTLNIPGHWNIYDIDTNELIERYLDR